MYLHGNKLRYMDIMMCDKMRTRIGQMQQKELLDNTLSVKVPFRYNRVDCKVEGLTPVQDLKEGDNILNAIQYCGQWGGGTFWKFDLVKKIDPPGES